MMANFDIFDDKFRININNHSVKLLSSQIVKNAESIDFNEKIRLLIQAIRCIDLTTLSGDDTNVSISRLCQRALNPITNKLIDELHENKFLNKCDLLTTAAVCVYPLRIKECAYLFESLDRHLNIASVATGFPSGQYGLYSRLLEITQAVEDGANEIDVVINRSLALNDDWHQVYNEIKEMKTKCKSASLKVILETGELGSLKNVYKASWVAMLAGADFIKTSTGKAVVNATLPVGIIMTRAIKDFYHFSGRKVGFKPAGGIRTEQDCLNWMKLVKVQLGEEWLQPKHFRIGASSLLNEIEKGLFKCIFHRQALPYEIKI